ncbi:hypothetical protein M3Y99_01781300 [Aphelenchoides fujianensis]|nr:hypothetical protein M3Y99_01781300 [Aphelenchoides fujianensis]
MAADKEEYLREFRSGSGNFYWRTLEQDLELGEVEEAAFPAGYPQFWRAIERGRDHVAGVRPAAQRQTLRRPKVEPIGRQGVGGGRGGCRVARRDGEFDEAPVFWARRTRRRSASGSSHVHQSERLWRGRASKVKEERHAPVTPQIPSGVSSAASEAFVGFSSSESEDDEAEDERVDDEEEDFRLDAPQTLPATPPATPLDEELERMRRKCRRPSTRPLRLRRVTEQNSRALSNQTNRFDQQKVRELEAERDRLAAQNAELHQQLGAASTKITVQRNEMASMQSLISDLKHHLALLLPSLEQEVARVRNVLDAVAEPQAE